MAKPFSFTQKSIFFLLPKIPLSSTSISLLSSSSPKPTRPHNFTLGSSFPHPNCFSTNSTPHPLRYDLVINTPSRVKRTRRQPTSAAADAESNAPENGETPRVELEFDDRVGQKLSLDRSGSPNAELDKSERNYYRKRIKRLYGSDCDDERGEGEGDFVELNPKVGEFDRLHEREQDLYFYDALAYPWEKDKHYKMVYKLEKKYLPDPCLGKAFIDESECAANNERLKEERKENIKENKEEQGGDRKLVFFDDDKEVRKDEGEKNVVEEFFKCSKKVPSESKDGHGGGGGDGEPYFVSRSSDLPPRWDGPNGTVVLINKPKGVFVAL